MMSQTTVSVRMDEQLKKEFDGVCNDLGLTMSTAVIMLAKKMAREKRIPWGNSPEQRMRSESCCNAASRLTGSAYPCCRKINCTCEFCNCCCNKVS